MQAGKRKQFFVATMEVATRRAQELRDEFNRVGAQACALTESQRIEAARCFEKLAGIASLEETVDYWFKHNQGFSKITVAQLQEEYLRHAVEMKLRPRSIDSLRSVISGFIQQHADSLLNTITRENIEVWVKTKRGGSDFTLRNVVTYLGMFFAFGMKRGYLLKNPMTGIEKPKKMVAEEVGILSVDDVQKLLVKAGEMDPRLIPQLALGFFAGIRSAELHRLTWEDIQFENRLIVVGAQASKCFQKRFVHMEDNLMDWLTKYREFTGLLPFGPKRFALRRQALCRVAGVEWPNNAMRHSFATYHLARGEDAAKTAFELGHTQGAQLLYRHYRGLVTRCEAERYWLIRPGIVATVEE
jgi:integrase